MLLGRGWWRRETMDRGREMIVSSNLMADGDGVQWKGGGVAGPAVEW